MEKTINVLEEASSRSVLYLEGGAGDLLAQVVVQGVLVALENGELYTFIGPQAVERGEELFGHWLFCADIRGRIDHFRVSLRH